MTKTFNCGVFCVDSGYGLYMDKKNNGGWIPRILITDIPEGTERFALSHIVDAARFSCDSRLHCIHGDYELFTEERWPCATVGSFRIPPEWDSTISYDDLLGLTEVRRGE